ncbi:Signal transduction histidine kinase [Amycolatopsis marina]|uniref:histidine kinase n=1 Tax=Amycolatopsis marina TaxID=490629 RepID=A0A1I1BPS8_9PSEU|nr:ATP-binding protein [Amycolatopsis marina]SFB50460.1 Signal transduction histidine kinase [Amycolatopsis marina]
MRTLLPSLRARATLLCAVVFVLGILIGVLGHQLSLAPTISEGVRGLGLFYFNPDDLDAWGPVFGLLAITPFLALGCWFLLRALLRPLPAMTAAVRRCGPQNLSQRVRLERQPRELDELAGSIDDLLDQLAVGYDSQRRFAANASHELRTPLAAQRTLIEVALAAPDASEEFRRFGAALLAINERNENLIEGLLVLVESERGVVSTQPARLDELVRGLADSLRELAARHEVTIEVHTEPRVVQADTVLLERLITNLLRNGILYNTPNGRLDVIVADDAALTVRNPGEPVPAELVQVLFEPFRRRGGDRISRGGAGLGLSIARSIVSAHDGSIEAVPNPEDGGLTVVVRLPPDQPAKR